jgi:lipopolysaccharide/colanic/teichoic acid biosynthesis glycosyltransferase
MGQEMNRMFNLFFACILFVLFFPLFLLVAFAISLDSPGNPVFVQKRTGKGGRVFKIYKFRTMIDEAEKQKGHLKTDSDGPVFRMKNDPRTTRVGMVLRSGFDESLQLINVVKGDMDLVGPRPLPVKEAAKISRKYFARTSVNPGITSPAVLNSRIRSDFNFWMRSDLEYIKKKSVLFDLSVLLNTLRLVRFYSFL